MIFDLTNMLGASLTDYIVSLETAKKGDGMFLLKGILPLDYYDNTPLMVDTPNYYYETTGTNIWDEVWEVGGLNISTGANDDTRTNRIRSKDFVRVIPNKQYYWHITNRASGNGLGWCYFYDINKNFLSRNSYNSITSAVISISSDCYFIRFETYEGYGNLYNKDVQICLHSLDETYQDLFEKVYHPYKKSTPVY